MMYPELKRYPRKLSRSQGSRKLKCESVYVKGEEGRFDLGRVEDA
jgi:hypothetical protein